jgi:molybdopterin converting factor subunit 1
MKIKIHYFASLKDILEKDSEVMEVPRGIKSSELLKIIKNIYPKLAEKKQILVAVNGAFTQPDIIIKKGDNVALFPPVSGG